MAINSIYSIPDQLDVDVEHLRQANIQMKEL